MRLLSMLVALLALTPGVTAAGVFQGTLAATIEGPLRSPTTVTLQPANGAGIFQADAVGGHVAASTARPVDALHEETEVPRGPEAASISPRAPRVTLTYELPQAYGPLVSSARVDRNDRTFAHAPLPAREAVRAPSPLTMLGHTSGGALPSSAASFSDHAAPARPSASSETTAPTAADMVDGTGTGAAPGAWQTAAAAAGAAALLILAPLALYHRLRGRGVLESDRRRELLEILKASPGLGGTEMGRALGVDPTTALYHLRRLVREGLVTVQGGTRAARYFVAGAHPADERARILAERAAGPLLEVIRQDPGMGKSALAARLDIARATLAWHLEGLERAGLVRSERAGREVRVYPAAGA